MVGAAYVVSVYGGGGGLLSVLCSFIVFVHISPYRYTTKEIVRVMSVWHVIYDII